MAPVGTRSIVWDGGRHDFCLSPMGHLFTLEQNCKGGIAQVYHRLVTGNWGVNDVREPIRLGLLGGGMNAKDAEALVVANVDLNKAGLIPSAILAQQIVKDVLEGVPEGEELGKPQAAEDMTGRTSSMTTVASAAPSSTASVPGSDLPHGKPTS